MPISGGTLVIVVVVVVIIIAVLYRRKKTIFIPSNTTQLTGNGWALACMPGSGQMQVIPEKRQVIMYAGNRYETNGNTYVCGGG